MCTKISTKRFQKGLQFFYSFVAERQECQSFDPMSSLLPLTSKLSNESQMSILSNLNDSNDNWFCSTWNITLKLNFESSAVQLEICVGFCPFYQKAFLRCRSCNLMVLHTSNNQ